MTTQTQSPQNPLAKFNFTPQPAAQRLIDSLVNQFLARCPGAADLSARMSEETGTRFKDWIDHIQVPRTAETAARLKELGFSHRPQPGAPECFSHEGAMFPSITLGGPSTGPASGATRVAIKVDSVADFLAVSQISDAEVIGEPLGQLRLAPAFRGRGTEMWIVERHGTRAFEPAKSNPAKAILSLRHLEAFRRRNRHFRTDAEGFAILNVLVDAAVKDLGKDWACDLFFAAEREYWQRRNRAAQVQRARQDKLGLGWANHDHHTYRSSRANFTRLVAIQEKLGFYCREAFYAGSEAGWGAQVMENPTTNITTFNDVDLSPEELLGDFSHDPEILSPSTASSVPSSSPLGTVGLWCGLHGEAILQAGMHHLECQFDHHALVTQLEHDGGIRTMAPFTTFPYLRQAFTEGERWPVDESRIESLLSKGQITQDQAEHFRRDGALGSHLENLERNDGFKGFNQQGVSDIIARTDPRRAVAPVGTGA